MWQRTQGPSSESMFSFHKAWQVCLFLEILILKPKKIRPGWIADQLENVNSFFLQLLNHKKQTQDTGTKGLGQS